MATNYIDPSGNGALTAWTNGATGATRLDDGVRSPTDARNSGDGQFISSLTDEQSQDIVFPNTLTFDSSQTLTLYIYGSGGVKRAVDVQTSTNDGTSWNTRQTNVVAAGAAAGWHTLVFTSDVTQQSHLDQLRVRLICNSTAGGGGATAAQVDAVYVQQSIPDPGRLDVSFAELETPDQPSGRLDVAWVELETPNQPDGLLAVSFAELEVPDEVTTPGTLEVAWAEMEVPTPPGRLDISWVEFSIEEESSHPRATFMRRSGRGMRTL